MRLGETIGIAPRPAGSWWLQTAELALELSAHADVRVAGGGLLGAGQARLLTVTLTPRCRGESLAQLRRDLQPYCRPEAGGLTLVYAGAARTVQLPCRYVEGLDTLRLVLAARAATWLSYANTMSGRQEGMLSLNTPTWVTPLGTAASAPLFELTYAAGGALTSIENSVAGVYDLAYQIVFAGAQPSGGTKLQVDCARVTVAPAAYLTLLQPGSTFGSFRLVGGVENVLTVAGANLTSVRYSYYPRFWSWEDADV